MQVVFVAQVVRLAAVPVGIGAHRGAGAVEDLADLRASAPGPDAFRPVVAAGRPGVLVGGRAQQGLDEGVLARVGDGDEVRVEAGQGRGGVGSGKRVAPADVAGDEVVVVAIAGVERRGRNGGRAGQDGGGGERRAGHECTHRHGLNP